MDNDITTASDKMINGIYSADRKRFIYSIELQSRQPFVFTFRCEVALL
jgi:hypothetical protein